jgi:hypothetical protein
MKTTANGPRLAPEPEALLPVERQPDVVAAWGAVLAARGVAREARARRDRAQEIAQPSQRAQSTSERVRQWTASDFWRARRSLAALDDAFSAAQADVEDAEVAHRAVVGAAKAALEPKVRASLAAPIQAVTTALASIRPTLETLAGAVTRAADLGVAAPAPTLVLAMIEQYIASLEHWIAPPRAATLPPGHVLVECRQSFRVLPTTGDIPRNPTGAPFDLGQTVGAGVTILPGDTCAVLARAADDLVATGRAVRVESARRS